VIGPEEEQLGVVMIRRALELAKEHELDLVEIAPTAKPPVCRIMDYSKYKYDQEKKERKIKKNQAVTHLKQIRLKPHIDENDYQVKLRQVIGFLGKKDKVKINMFYKGRELAHRDLGKQIIERMVVDIAQYGQPEKSAVFEGRVMSIVIAPSAVALKKETKSDEDAE
jgi:translation initiation factor IF-3